jgi:hypothetical protein
MAHIYDEEKERLVGALNAVEHVASRLAPHDEKLTDVLHEMKELRVEILSALAGFPPPFVHGRPRYRSEAVAPQPASQAR